MICKIGHDYVQRRFQCPMTLHDFPIQNVVRLTTELPWRRTCIHLGVPVDVQAAESPVPLKPFCAADVRDDVELATSHSHTLKRPSRHLMKIGEDRYISSVVWGLV